MHNRRNILALSVAAALTTGAALFNGGGYGQGVKPVPTRSRRKGKGRGSKGSSGVSKYRPHQGARECARRRGEIGVNSGDSLRLYEGDKKYIVATDLRTR